ncbi:MAG: hypothetical protein H6Q18_114 [Bacteroidetes bacterium]|nr:hypothetical protein [Bacteroidota bacterium]
MNMKKNIFKIKLTYTVALALLALLGSCSADLIDNGITPKTALDADFTVTTVSQNNFTLTSSNNNYIFSQWDLDDGLSYVQRNNNMSIFLPDAGTYIIKHRVVGAGGVLSDPATKTITVATSDPVAGNLILGGKFANATDISKWTVDNLTGGIVTFADGWVKFTNNPGSWGQAAIQQPITVVAGKKYQIDMLFKTDGLKNGWFKVYACTTKPTAGAEYKGDILVAEVAIWGDNIGPKSGKFSDLLNPDSGTKTKNIVTFSQSGTIYLSIQCGAENLKDGVSISSVEFRGVAQ